MEARLVCQDVLHWLPIGLLVTCSTIYLTSRKGDYRIGLRPSVSASVTLWFPDIFSKLLAGFASYLVWRSFTITRRFEKHMVTAYRFPELCHPLIGRLVSWHFLKNYCLICFIFVLQVLSHHPQFCHKMLTGNMIGGNF